MIFNHMVEYTATMRTASRGHPLNHPRSPAPAWEHTAARLRLASVETMMSAHDRPHMNWQRRPSIGGFSWGCERKDEAEPRGGAFPGREPGNEFSCGLRHPE